MHISVYFELYHRPGAQHPLSQTRFTPLHVACHMYAEFALVPRIGIGSSHALMFCSHVPLPFYIR